MVIAINDRDKQFDMRVKSCTAHDGLRGPIQLTDDRGCVLRPKMLTAFMKVRDYSGKASVVAFSHFYAFKFPDTIEVQIQCVVEICRHGCPEDCPANLELLQQQQQQQQYQHQHQHLQQEQQQQYAESNQFKQLEKAPQPAPSHKEQGGDHARKPNEYQEDEPVRHTIPYDIPGLSLDARPGHYCT